MPALVCLGDATTHGGKVISASSTMFINGIQVALVGDLVSCPKHGSVVLLKVIPRHQRRAYLLLWIIASVNVVAVLSVLIPKTVLSHNYAMACS